MHSVKCVTMYICKNITENCHIIYKKITLWTMPDLSMNGFSLNGHHLSDIYKINVTH